MLVIINTSNNNNNDLDPRLSLFSRVGDDVIHPCIICGGGGGGGGGADTRPKTHPFVAY